MMCDGAFIRLFQGNFQDTLHEYCNLTIYDNLTYYTCSNVLMFVGILVVMFVVMFNFMLPVAKKFGMRETIY